MNFTFDLTSLDDELRLPVQGLPLAGPVICLGLAYAVITCHTWYNRSFRWNASEVWW